jgi:glycosyltransferase involved in cell wall biosynthesis
LLYQLDNSINAINVPFKILYLVLNPFTNDTRVLRAAETCVEMRGEATVFALHEPKLARREVIRGIHVRRFKLLTRPLSKRVAVQFIKYLESFIRMLWAGLNLRPKIVHANDLPTLPTGYVIACFTGTRLIYDSHELYSDRGDLPFLPKWFLELALVCERFLAKRADSVITVSDGISLEIDRGMGIGRPFVIRNMSAKTPLRAGVKKDSRLLRQALGIKEEIPIILYQGMIAKGRGLLTLVFAMTKLSHPSAVLVFLGNGALVSELRARAKSRGLESRVYFHAAVSPGILPYWTRGADLGVHPIEGICKNHRLCLPNKLFEYIQAGLPVVVTDLPEMRKIVSHYGVGEVFRDGDAEDLAAKIDSLLVNGHKYRLASRAAANVLTWDVEKLRLIDIYKSVLRP